MRVLLCETDASLCQFTKETLAKKGYWVISASDPSEAFALLRKHPFQLVVIPADSDLSESGLQAQSVYAAKQIRPDTKILATLRKHSTTHIVECMRAGASDVWVHNTPAEQGNERALYLAIEKNRERLCPTSPDELETDAIQAQFPQLVGRHPSLLEIFRIIERVKDTESTVLITGESGTGKELVASAIHFLSRRKKKPWVAVNCGAIPSTLLESELFGHMKGAFTGATQNRIGRFQMANEGTLFLDEISDLSLDLQAKILRAIQNRTFEPVGSPHSLELNARLVAATNQDLENAVADKQFREDLFYRLNVIPIKMPSLRHRKTDIPFLVRAFVDRFNQANARNVAGITEEAMLCLVQYHWPGNVRELENLIERVIVLKADDDPIEPKDFPVGYFKKIRLERFMNNVSLPDDGLNLNMAVDDFENELILQALRKTEGNKNKAAMLLKLNRTTLVEKLKRKELKILP